MDNILIIFSLVYIITLYFLKIHSHLGIGFLNIPVYEVFQLKFCEQFLFPPCVFYVMSEDNYNSTKPTVMP